MTPYSERPSEQPRALLRRVHVPRVPPTTHLPPAPGGCGGDPPGLTHAGPGDAAERPVLRLLLLVLWLLRLLVLLLLLLKLELELLLLLKLELKPELVLLLLKLELLPLLLDGLLRLLQLVLQLDGLLLLLLQLVLLLVRTVRLRRLRC